MFAVAQWPDKVWNLLEKIVLADITIQGVNVNYVKPKAITAFKELTSKINDAEKVILLSKVIQGELTLSEMGKRACTIRQLKKVQKFMMMDLGEVEWGAVKLKYPKFATPKCLHQWIMVARLLTEKENRRPPEWEVWIDNIKQYGQRLQAEKDCKDLETFSFPSRKNKR